MAWERSFASAVLDVDDFAAFQCWNGDRATPWIAVVEDYVRVSVLRAAVHILAFRDGNGELVAVSAFDPTDVEIPLIEPVAHPGWTLQVLAIRLQHQRNGHSREVYRQTFEAMCELNPARSLVTARIHRQHTGSMTAARRAGLDLFLTGTEFHTMLGELPDVLP